ncbi:MAG: hypothetical protein ACSHYA_18605 [Opitutaceae bacterium]
MSLITRSKRCFKFALKGLALTTFLLIPASIALFAFACTIKAPSWDKSFTEPVVQEHFKWLGHVVNRSHQQKRLDLYTGYYDICGQGPEWDYGFYVFYAMCLEQLAKQDPSKLDYAIEQLEHCTDLMMRVHSDDEGDSGEQHDEYTASLVTGYQCIVLSIRKAMIGDERYDTYINGVSKALNANIEIQLERSGAIWTSDQTTHLYAIYRADQVFDTDHSSTRERWFQTMQSEFIQDGTDLLYSRVSINPKRIDSPPRASSLAWTIIFLKEMYPTFVAQQFTGLEKHRSQRVFSLAVYREFPGWGLLRLGDMDSGPLILGFSPSATGFSLAAQKLYGNHKDYQRTYRIFEIFGRPISDKNGKRYRMGNAMGDAILLYSMIAD